MEPEDLVAAAFALTGPIAAGGPVYGAGEPSIWAALDGTIYAAFPGCDDGPYYLGPQLPGAETCAHGLVWRSSDDGASFTRLNRHPDGRLTDEGPAANGDVDVAVDAAGAVYTSNLGGGGIQFHRSTDNGTTWQYLGNIVPPRQDDPEAREGADRQWMAAAGPGHVINTWMRTSPNRDVAINTTFDGGATWTGTQYFGDGIGWLGTVQFAPDGQRAYIPYTQPLSASTCGVHVVSTHDGGLTWSDVDTGARIVRSSQGGHWSCVQMAPAIDVSGDGSVLAAWSEDVLEPTGTTSRGTRIVGVLSQDNGTTWSQAIPLVARTPSPMAPGPAAIMPWVVGGAGDRFAVTYFRTDAALDTDLVATTWDVAVTVFDGLGGQRREATTIIDADVHEGPLCARGSGCTPARFDRALLDFFEADVTPDGNIVVVYPADPVDAGKEIEIRVAVQDGGTPLLLRPT